MKPPKVINAPDHYVADGRPSIFLAGGISGWRQSAIKHLSEFDGVVLNPRIEHWPTNESIIKSQITWEHHYLREATLRVFWFSSETTCETTLFELGLALGEGRPSVIGAHPEYQLRHELQIRCRLVRPELRLARSIESLCQDTLSSHALTEF